MYGRSGEAHDNQYLSRRNFIKLSAIAGSSTFAFFLLDGCSSGSSSASASASASSAAASGSASAASASASSAAASGTRTMVDATGNQVEIPEHPQRIVVAPGPAFAMVYALMGTVENVVTMHKVAWTGYENSIMKEIAPEGANIDHSIFGGETINVEALINLNPDMAILWTSQEKVAEKLKEAGIPSVQLKAASTMEELETLISMMGDALNVKDRADQYLTWYAEFQDEIDKHAKALEAIPKEQRPKALHFYTVADLNIYQYGSCNLDLTAKAGATNYDGSNEEEASVTMESILAYDPDVIFISNFDEVTPADFYENKLEGQDWTGVSAVENKRIYKVPMGLYRWEPPNTIEKPLYYHWIAQKMLPEVYSDFDSEKELKDFFSKFLSYELTQAQIDEMLRKEVNSASK